MIDHGDIPKLQPQKPVIDSWIKGAGGLTSPLGKQYARMYHDVQGRITREEFHASTAVGGGVYVNNFRNEYVFDEKGRLMRMEQVYNLPDGREEKYRGWEYQYPSGEPDDHYTEVYRDYSEGKTETKTWQDRQKKGLD